MALVIITSSKRRSILKRIYNLIRQQPQTYPQGLVRLDKAAVKAHDKRDGKRIHQVTVMLPATDSRRNFCDLGQKKWMYQAVKASPDLAGVKCS